MGDTPRRFIPCNGSRGPASSSSPPDKFANAKGGQFGAVSDTLYSYLQPQQQLDGHEAGRRRYSALLKADKIDAVITTHLRNLHKREFPLVQERSKVAFQSFW